MPEPRVRERQCVWNRRWELELPPSGCGGTPPECAALCDLGGACVGPGRWAKEDIRVFGGGSSACRARMRSERGAAHRARELEGREDARSARGRTRESLRAGDDDCARERGQGHGPNVQVNRRAQRVRLNLVLGRHSFAELTSCRQRLESDGMTEPRVPERQCVWNRRRD